MVRLNLSSNNVRNCEKITRFVKECEKIIECKEKGILNLAFKQDFYLKNRKNPTSLKKFIKKCSK